jgi:hypothetical protein
MNPSGDLVEPKRGSDSIAFRKGDDDMAGSGMAGRKPLKH